MNLLLVNPPIYDFTAEENSDDCEWSIYDGPLFIDFRLPVEWSVQGDGHRTPVAPEQIVLEDVGRLATGNAVEAIELSLASADDGYETGAEVLRQAFPKLHALIENCSQMAGEIDGEAALPE